MRKIILVTALLFSVTSGAQYFGYFNSSLKSPSAGRTKQGRAGIDICNNGPLVPGQTMCADGSGVVGFGAGYTCSNWCNLAAPNTGCKASAGANGLNAECQTWCIEVAPNCNATTSSDDM